VTVPASADPGTRANPVRVIGLVAVAFLAGFALMVVELSAVRALAPSFGDSAPVWTNVIGVILLALAIGALLGGTCADRGLGRRLLPCALLIAAAVTCALPWLVPRAAAWILPDSLPLERALPVLVEGSLAVTLLLFAPPVLLLGAVSPVLIALGTAAGLQRVGRVSGIVYAAGTLGSLLGTFLATHVLVPFLGLVTTFLAAGGCLAAAAGLALVAARARAATWFVPVALLPGALGFLDDTRPVWLGEDRLLDQRDSAYQRLWVVESLVPVDGAVRRMRRLKINEGLDSFHSVWIEGSPFTDGAYYDAVAVLPLALGAGGALPERVRVLSLGCAAGSILRGLAAVCGERLEAVGVDLDPVVLELAQKWFEIDASRWTLVGDVDARAYVERVNAPIDRFDVVYVDTYRSQIYLPPHLASVEFFRAVQRRLRPGGAIALNVGDLGPSAPSVALSPACSA
jgi:predicted membrane-bound spermidine synthase